MNETTSRLIPVNEAFSTQLRISRSLGYKLIREGKLSAVKIGARSYFTAEELARFVASLPRLGGK